MWQEDAARETATDAAVIDEDKIAADTAQRPQGKKNRNKKRR
jgi:hypothetical protein